jgi:hypothetical protein
MFDPKAHLIQLPRRVKDPTTGQFITRQDEYLEVRYRVQWFREKFPHGQIETKFFCLDWEKGIAICHATVSDGEGGQSTATGTETRKGFEDFVEKSETRSVGRALALLGFGTQFVGEELDEGDHVADAAVAPPAPAPSPNGHPPTPKAEARMTEEAIAELFHLALECCGDEKESFGTRVRRAMGVSAETKINKKFVREHLSPEAYRTVYGWYETLYAQLQRKTEVPNGNAPQEAAVSQSAAAAPEAPPAGPSPAGSLSAPEPSPGDAAVDPAYHKLYQEAVGWGVAESEIRHILGHHEPAKARVILWKARRNEPPPTWVAAD